MRRHSPTLENLEHVIHCTLLAAACALATGCTLGPDPSEKNVGQGETDVDPTSPQTAPSNVPATTDSAHTATAGQGASTGDPLMGPAQDAGAQDSNTNPTPAAHDPRSPGSGAAGGSGTSGNANPSGSSDDAGLPGTPSVGGNPGQGDTMLSAAEKVSLACATEFADCMLTSPLDADSCLHTYADCEPQFQTDGGINGECVVHFGACVLGNPTGFEACFPMLTDCDA